MRISDWSSDVCSSDLEIAPGRPERAVQRLFVERIFPFGDDDGGQRIAGEIGERAALAHEAVDAEDQGQAGDGHRRHDRKGRSEEHTSELQSLMRISYAVFCLKKKKTTHTELNDR